MKAIRVREQGAPEVLVVEEVDDPRPGPGEVLVGLHAAGVNMIDVQQRSGGYPVPLPFTPGTEGAGEVVEVGADVEAWTAGDRVAYAGVPGAYAELALVPAERLVPVPGEVPTDIAAAVLLQGMTAHYLLHSIAALSGGEVVVVQAAAGGVGLLLTQMATAAGIHVIGTTSTDEKAALVRDAGAVEVVVRGRDDLAATVAERTDGTGARVVFDSVGRDTFDESLGSAGPARLPRPVRSVERARSRPSTSPGSRRQGRCSSRGRGSPTTWPPARSSSIAPMPSSHPWRVPAWTSVSMRATRWRGPTRPTEPSRAGPRRASSSSSPIGEWTDDRPATRRGGHVRAALLTGPATLEVRDRDDPRPDPHEVVVRVESIGICGTDLSIYAGKIPVTYPRVMGHEIVGTLATGARAGERVLVDPGIACGRCTQCRENRTNICTRGLADRSRPRRRAERAGDDAGLERPSAPGRTRPATAPLLQVLATCVHAQRRIRVFPERASCAGVGRDGAAAPPAGEAPGSRPRDRRHEVGAEARDRPRAGGGPARAADGTEAEAVAESLPGGADS